MTKQATTMVPLHPLLAERWSPRAFDATHELGDAQVTALLEAARWAPSANNTQPWRFLVARRGDGCSTSSLPATSCGPTVRAP